MLKGVDGIYDLPSSTSGTLDAAHAKGTMANARRFNFIEQACIDGNQKQLASHPHWHAATTEIQITLHKALLIDTYEFQLLVQKFSHISTMQWIQ